MNNTIKYRSNTDKIDGFTYYTFEITEDIKIVISKFDGKEWKIASKLIDSELIKKLGEVVDKEK